MYHESSQVMNHDSYDAIEADATLCRFNSRANEFCQGFHAQSRIPDRGGYHGVNRDSELCTYFVAFDK